MADAVLDLDDPVVHDILVAATDEFSRFGFGGARLERVVERTATSKRMVYYHFGSKEGLYRAVLEQAFASVRARSQDFDPEAGTAEEALRALTATAFDDLVEHPEFVRLLTFENLAGSPHIQGSALISSLNQRALRQLERVLIRGQEAGVVRADVTPIDVYITLVGLSYYHVANRSGYMAGGFADEVQQRVKSAAFDRQRREVIIEIIWRFARAG